MTQKEFDPRQYRNKKTIYVRIPNAPGVYTIWDWSTRSKKYIRRTIGNRYYAAKRVGGEQAFKCFADLIDAKAWQVDKSDPAVAMLETLTFGELKEKFLLKKKDEVRISTLETIESKMKHLEFFDKMFVRDITPKTIDAWLEFLKRSSYLQLQHNSRLTYRHELSALRQILDHYSEYLCEDNAYSLPIKKRHRLDCIVDRVKNELAKARLKKKFLPRAEVSRFLTELKQNANELYYLVALFQVGTGTRIGEVCAMDWTDINLDSCSAYVHRNVCWSRKKGRETFISPLTKTGDARLIGFPNAVADELKRLKLKSGRSKGLVFSLDGITPLTYRSVQSQFDRALKHTGSEWRGTHIMRHTFSTDYLERTKNPKALQGQLGHRTAEQTNHYAKITERTKQDGMAEYDKSFAELLEAREIG